LVAADGAVAFAAEVAAEFAGAVDMVRWYPNGTNGSGGFAGDASAAPFAQLARGAVQVRSPPKQERTGMLKEFRDFAVKGNVLDMAVGIIIGAAFGTVVQSLVKDVIMPPVGLLVGGVDFAELAIPLGNGPDGAPVAIAIGLFLNALFSFLIVSFSVFLLVRSFNRLKREQEAAPQAPPPPPPPSAEAQLLGEIRDLLKAR
jgi:large conductance mechanosensitive channel